ncbi:MAG: hypothetical protein HUK40_03970 [Desulfobacter sp.]|nr:hypothetical protein [Desulfobacter sp.]
MNEVPKPQKALVKALVSATPFSYEADAHFPILLKNIEMTVSLGRITHDNKPDLLVNTGSVYGMALELVKKNGYEILNLSPDLTFGETALMLFAKLGYTTWKNPSFNSNGRVETISGIYVNAQMEKYFITRTPPLERAESFLKNEGITLLNLGEDPTL